MLQLSKLRVLEQSVRQHLRHSLQRLSTTQTRRSDNHEQSDEWRDSASIILAAKDTTGTGSGLIGDKQSAEEKKPYSGEFDYKVLMLERNKKSRFFAGDNVFPGGATSDADFSLEWANVFRYCTKRDLGDILNDLTVGRHRAPMMGKYDRSMAIPPELGLRITAIREMFEESGVLLVKGARMPKVEDSVIEEFKSKVKKDPGKFAAYCKELQVVPDVWALQEWSNWLTPVQINQNTRRKPIRYDTIFYLCCLDWIPLVHVDGGEITDAAWVDPGEYFTEDMSKYGPQPFEMARIHNFPRLSVLHTFAAQRAALGLERYMTVYIECKDGIVGVLPGDDLYPDKPDYEGKKMTKPQPHTMDDLRAVTKRHHRQEHRHGAGEAAYVRNVDFKYGQPVPHKALHTLKGGL